MYFTQITILAEGEMLCECHGHETLALAKAYADAVLCAWGDEAEAQCKLIFPNGRILSLQGTQLNP